MGPRAKVATFVTVGAILERLPLRWSVRFFSSVARVFASRISGTANLAANLDVITSDGERGLAPADRERLTKRALASYGQYWAEGAKLPALSQSTITRRFVVGEGLEHLQAAYAEGKGVVVALPHIGSWEWGGSVITSQGMPITVVAEELEPPALFEWFRRKRAAVGIRVEPLNAQASSTLLAVLREGGLVGLLCDRDIQGGGIEVDFFGRRVTVPGGPATLALRSGAALLAAACYIGPGEDHYAVISRPIEATRQGRLRDDVERVSQAVTDELARLIRRAPEQWHVLEDRFAPLS